MQKHRRKNREIRKREEKGPRPDSDTTGRPLHGSDTELFQPDAQVVQLG